MPINPFDSSDLAEATNKCQFLCIVHVHGSSLWQHVATSHHLCMSYELKYFEGSVATR